MMKKRSAVSRRKVLVPVVCVILLVCAAIFVWSARTPRWLPGAYEKAPLGGCTIEIKNGAVQTASVDVLDGQTRKIVRFDSKKTEVTDGVSSRNTSGVSTLPADTLHALLGAIDKRPDARRNAEAYTLSVVTDPAALHPDGVTEYYLFSALDGLSARREGAYGGESDALALVGNAQQSLVFIYLVE